MTDHRFLAICSYLFQPLPMRKRYRMTFRSVMSHPYHKAWVCLRDADIYLIPAGMT